MSSLLWSRFRKIRAVIFALSTLLSIAWTVIFTILLLREWSGYNGGQRATVIALLSINVISSIFMYLMIVVRFTLWIDAARVTLILFFQLGGTIAFALLSPVFPCNNIGTPNNCKNITSAVIIGGWALSGLLLLYAFLLAIMSYMPPSTPPGNPEEALSAYVQERALLSHSPTPSIKSETHLLGPDEKHRSMDSTSFYCRGTDSLPSLGYTNTSSFRSHSPALSRVSSLRSTWSDRSHPRSPAVSPHPTLHPQHVLPNPFADPVPRYTSPLSQSSLSSSKSNGFNHDYEHAGQFPRALILNSALSPVYRAGSVLPSSYMEERRTPYQSPYPSSTPFTPNSPGIPIPSTPISLRPAVQATVPFRNYTKSPGFQSVRSMAASMHSPGRSASFSTSRIPSPVLSLPTRLPSSPRPALRPHAVAISPRTKGVAQIRRVGSESNITFNTQYLSSRSPNTALPMALRVASPEGQPDWLAPKSDRSVDFKQWKEAVLGAAAGGQIVR